MNDIEEIMFIVKDEYNTVIDWNTASKIYGKAYWYTEQEIEYRYRNNKPVDFLKIFYKQRTNSIVKELSR